jgi:dihydroflavonol-4-reductase
MAGRAFVTGGSGFVGGALIRRLVSAGTEVVALARSGSAVRAVEALGARPVVGSLEGPAGLAGAMRGCDVVYHVAGVSHPCRRDPSEMFHVNVGGTRSVVRAAADARVGRLVHTSSGAAIGERRGEVGREDTRHRGTFLTAYERSKFEAERAALGLGAELGLEVVVVNPTSVQGPGRSDGTARLLLLAMRGRIVPAIDTHLGLVDVDDCAEGHVLAAERGTPGERYLLCGASVSMRELFGALERVLGRPIRAVFVPAALLSAAGMLGEGFGRLTGRTPPVCRELARSSRHGHRFDGSRVVRELGLSYTPLEGTLRRLVGWFEASGLLRRPG